MKNKFKKELLSVRICLNRSAIGFDAAHLTARKIRHLLEIRDSISIIFAAEPSQKEFLETLSLQPNIEWNRVTAFHMEEYVGLPADDPQGFGNFLKKEIFSKVPFKEVHFLNGNAADLELECKRYSGLLADHNPEIVCMGIGENAHLAFNDPHVADLNDHKAVKVVALDPQSRLQQVHDGCFIAIDRVPAHALTLTMPTLMRAESVFCVAPGKTRSQAVLHTLTEAVSAAYPSTALRQHANAILFLDHDSAGKLNNASPS